jgi:hypothetical protein
MPFLKFLLPFLDKHYNIGKKISEIKSFAYLPPLFLLRILVETQVHCIFVFGLGGYGV